LNSLLSELDGLSVLMFLATSPSNGVDSSYSAREVLAPVGAELGEVEGVLSVGELFGIHNEPVSAR
jgi:hypothetical protein